MQPDTCRPRTLRGWEGRSDAAWFEILLIVSMFPEPVSCSVAFFSSRNLCVNWRSCSTNLNQVDLSLGQFRVSKG